jgi:hypothetical protein
LPSSAVDVVSPAIEHTKQQLFKPFRFGQWTRLALVGLIAGELGSGGGCNSNFQIPQIPHQSQGTEHFLRSGFSFPTMAPGALAALIATLIVAGIVLLVILLYLNSMMRFVLFDSVVQRECRIGESWRRRTRPGFRYFLWQIGFMLFTWLVMVVIFGIPAIVAFSLGWFKNPGDHLAGLILGGIALFFLLFAFFVVIITVAVMTKDFVVPQMALEDIGAVEAWRRLLDMMNAEKWSYAGYIGMKIVLAIAAGILVGIVSFIATLILLIPFGGLGAIAILAGKAAGMGWNIVTIGIAVTVGLILLVIILYVVSLISVPVVIFFPAYALYFFAARYPRLQGVLYIPPVLPQQPPPLPPFSPAPGTVG